MYFACNAIQLWNISVCLERFYGYDNIRGTWLDSNVFDIVFDRLEKD